MKSFSLLFLLGIFLVISANFGLCHVAESAYIFKSSDFIPEEPNLTDMGFPPNWINGSRIDDILSIDPIEDHYFGESFFINGTANLYPDETISVQITAGNTTTEKNHTGEFLGISKMATIVNRTNTTTQWYVLVNTSDTSAHFIPDESYHVIINRIYLQDGSASAYWARLFQFYLHNGSRPISTIITPTSSISSESKKSLQNTQALQQTANNASPLEQILPVIAISLIIILVSVKKREK